MADLSVKFCGLEFKDPFILAASPCTDELDMVRNGFKAGWSTAVLKTTHSESVVFNPVSPLLAGLDVEDKRMVGSGNIDVNSKYHVGIVEERVKVLKNEFPDKIVMVSFVGTALEKETWQEPARRLVAAGVDGIELDACCPQGLPGEPGRLLCADAQPLSDATRWVKEAAGSVPVIVKAAGAGNDVEAAQAIKDGGGDAISAMGLCIGLMGVDLDTFVPLPSVGGKSTFSAYLGPAVKPVALGVVCQIAMMVNIPISGAGGASTWQDVLEFMLLGATTVQFGTAVQRNGFRIIDDLKDGVEAYMEEKNISKLSDIIGKAVPNVVLQDDLSQDYKVVSSLNRETCIKDDLCYIACRDGGHMAMELDEQRIPVIDEEKCAGCGLCTMVCPVWDCVTLKPVEGK